MPGKNDNIVCSGCREEVNPEFDFCPNCGAIIIENVNCYVHQNREAIGVCIICSTPVCKKCGLKTDGHFLCKTHSNYEIYEGMARVFGANDSAMVELAKSELGKENLHPFIYSRKASPISIGGPEYTLFRASGEYNGRIINEFKLMVPCQEVETAESILKKLEFLS